MDVPLALALRIYDWPRGLLLRGCSSGGIGHHAIQASLRRRMAATCCGSGIVNPSRQRCQRDCADVVIALNLAALPRSLRTSSSRRKRSAPSLVQAITAPWRQQGPWRESARGVSPDRATFSTGTGRVAAFHQSAVQRAREAAPSRASDIAPGFPLLRDTSQAGRRVIASTQLGQCTDGGVLDSADQGAALHSVPQLRRLRSA